MKFFEDKILSELKTVLLETGSCCSRFHFLILVFWVFAYLLISPIKAGIFLRVLNAKMALLKKEMKAKQ
jgi:hypothetical protein